MKSGMEIKGRAKKLRKMADQIDKFIDDDTAFPDGSVQKFDRILEELAKYIQMAVGHNALTKAS